MSQATAALAPTSGAHAGLPGLGQASQQAAFDAPPGAAAPSLPAQAKVEPHTGRAHTPNGIALPQTGPPR